MPLYMDRHDLPCVTAEEVARTHVSDLRVQDRHGVQFLAYWFDAAEGQAFCLANAPSPEDMQAVHRENHGPVANEVISVSEGEVLRFLGRISDPPDASEVDGAFRTIMFTDLQGSTSLLRDVGEPAYLDLLTEHDRIIRRSLRATRGREVKHTGDGIMASFDDIAGALTCALAIQDGFRTRNAAGAMPALLVRIGMAAGHPVDRHDDLFGSTVNLASRICDAADPGRILTSELVREMAADQGFAFGQGRDIELKGFGAVCVFELVQARPSASAR